MPRVNLLDHLGRLEQDVLGNGEAEGLGSLGDDYGFEPLDLLQGQGSRDGAAGLAERTDDLLELVARERLQSRGAYIPLAA